MADSPEIKVHTQKIEKSESLDTTSGVKREKRQKRTKQQRKSRTAKKSILRRIFSSKKEFNPEEDNILNRIMDGIADKIGETVDSALENNPQPENPLQELEELHPPKLPDLKELAEEIKREKLIDDDDNKDDEDPDFSPPKNKIRL